MADITLFLTRKPIDEFVQVGDRNADANGLSDGARNQLYGRTGPRTDSNSGNKLASGIWGTLGVMQGPKVLSARLLNVPAVRIDDFVTPPELPLPGVFTATRYVQFAGRVLEYRTIVFAAQVESFKQYTTSERYRTDYGELGGNGYIILQPRPDNPYPLQTQPHNTTVQTLRPGHNGNCIRILGTTRPKEDAILIHEAPSVGWVIGCIGPRPYGNHDVFPNQDGNLADVSFSEIFRQVNIVGGGTASFIVLDW